MLQLAIRQVQKAASFQDASGDLREMLGVPICPSHLRKISQRIGGEWLALRRAEVKAFRDDSLASAHPEAPQVAAVMVDGGRLQARAEEAGRGITDPGWRETKVACCQTLSSPARAADPQPEPPAKFLDPAEAARLAAEIKSRGAGKAARAAKRPERAKKKPRRRRQRRQRQRPRKLVRTVVASLANSEGFGWQVAAEVHRRGLHRAARKAYVCDGQRYNWALHEMHLLPWGFIAILDFLHLLGYLYTAAQAAFGKATPQAWECYERWLRWAWSGEVGKLLGGLREASGRLGEPPEGCGEDDPRKVVSEALGYVGNNRKRMDYPRYRMLGLPVSSAPVESTIKQLNRRLKGSEKFWLEGGAEAMLQLRAAHLSEDGTAERYRTHPRPPSRAVGEGRLRPVN